ncbi:DUF3016 domain-containing protein [Thalassotalea litorea]|uniref:DUF3016 domain-containing protein n=1 Tax=Thalassotalea litorea TaxID=2020715 RepID=A0A5R9IT38_9GAMM|nr:DUF3016 domain-containing protein [Thalassotalea litorea]TLU65088.1 DUF3016 domain-containing protein [Thalassotalea litorea]
MNKLLMAILAILLVSCSSTEQAPKNVTVTDRNVTVTLLNTADFSDIDAGNTMVQSKFEDSVAKSLAEALADSVEERNVTIELKFSDIDLAGETRFNAQEIRVLKDSYIPRMEFEYEIKDAAGSVVKTETANIKDMGYLSRTLFGLEANESFGYDRRLLVEYFKEVFSG